MTKKKARFLSLFAQIEAPQKKMEAPQKSIKAPQNKMKPLLI
jgi:hypothetical protein